MVGKVRNVISASDIRVAFTVAAKNPGSARAMKAGVDCSATKTSTIARIISHA